MHTKMEAASKRRKEIYSANIHPERGGALHIFAEARIFNYKSHFAFFSFNSLFFIAHPPMLRTVNKSFSMETNGAFFLHLSPLAAPFRSTHFHVTLCFDRYVLE